IIYEQAFTGVQFADENGDTVALVRTSWLTPRKTEVFWPPYKTQEQFNKSLKEADLPSECWKTYKISQIFFDSDKDDLGKAQRKVRQLEYTSDIKNDDPENTTFPTKRPRITPRRLYDSCSSDDDDNNNDSSTNKKQTIPRPPLLTKNSQDSVFVDSNVISPKTQHLINVINSTQSNISSYSTPVSSRGSTPTSKESVRTSEAVQKGAPDSTITEIEDTIKTWLKHSPQRLKLAINIMYKKQHDVCLGRRQLYRRIAKEKSTILKSECFSPVPNETKMDRIKNAAIDTDLPPLPIQNKTLKAQVQQPTTVPPPSINVHEDPHDMYKREVNKNEIPHQKSKRAIRVRNDKSTCRTDQLIWKHIREGIP
ncbi:hypothetical protein CBL_20145, partial [Carabus blaptoides fortunei]